MRKIIFVACLSLTMFIVPTMSQDDNYRLRQPFIDDYLQVIQDHANEITSSGSAWNDTVSAVSQGMLYLFQSDPTATFDSLNESYQLLGVGYLDNAYRRDWNVLLVQRWFDEHQPDLSQTHELKLAPDFEIAVTPRDFNVDGQDEYVLDVYNVDTIHQYLVAVLEDTGYRIIDPGVSWSGYTAWGRYSEGDGFIEEYDFRDLTGDGLPEWLILFYGDTSGGPGMGYVDSGALFVVGWRDDTLKLLSLSWLNRELDMGRELTFSEEESRAEHPVTVNWSFENLDDDAALEINQSQSYTNNWGCRRVETMRFDWNPDADFYLYTDTAIVYDESQNCVQQQAEESMWEKDYATAIDLFKQALTLPAMTYESDYAQKMAQSQNQYLRARLAMAYLLTDQVEHAQIILDELIDETIHDEAVKAYINALYSYQDAELMNMCAAAFNVFAYNFPSIVIGGTTDRPYYDGPAYDPAQVGCDAPRLVQEHLDNARIPINQSPLEWLDENDIGVGKTLVADLNQDGIDEILVWTDVASIQILFVSQSEYFVVGFVELDPYQHSDELTIWQLPDGAGLGIATLEMDFVGAYYQNRPWPGSYSQFDGLGGGPLPQCPEGETTADANVVRLWRLDETSLTEILDIPTCADTIVEALGDGEQTSITTIYQNYSYSEGDVLQVYTDRYAWDDNQQQYVWDPPATPTPQATAIPTSTPEPETSPQRTYYSVHYAFSEQAYTAVLDMTPQTVDLTTTEYPDRLLADMYLRALSLEILGQDEEALTLFIELQSIAPEHTIGGLSALHFEQVTASALLGKSG